MGKIKATTLVERFGFKDRDLYSPTHDEIIVNLLSEENMIHLLKLPNFSEYVKYRIEISCPYIIYKEPTSGCGHPDSEKGLCFFDFSDWKTHQARAPEFCPPYEIILPLRNSLDDISIEELLQGKIEIKTEVIIKNERQYEIGFVDLKAYVPQGSHYIELNDYFNAIINFEMYFEIKTKIDSFGATMRQLNMYRENGATPIVLITCDNRFRDAFEGQGVHMVYWPDFVHQIATKEDTE